jgi:hypothetical protein
MWLSHSKHPAHSRILEQKNIVSLQACSETVKTCEASVRRSKELLEQSPRGHSPCANPDRCVTVKADARRAAASSELIAV